LELGTKTKQPILCGSGAQAKTPAYKNRLEWKGGVSLHQLCLLDYFLAERSQQPIIRHIPSKPFAQKSNFILLNKAVKIIVKKALNVTVLGCLQSTELAHLCIAT